MPLRVFNLGLPLIIALTFLFSTAHGQSIKGRITDTTGDPIPFASVFIKELSMGAASNIDGFYSFNIPSGSYTLTFQSLGFNSETRSIDIGNSTLELNIVLSLRSYNLAAVKITAKSEDAAYGVMRKVIAMAPYYQRNVNSYDALIYIKGSAKVNKLSRLVKRQLRKEADAPKEGESYVYESQNSLSFKAPNAYKQKVIAARSTFPGMDEQMSIGFLTTSFYQPTFATFISPLAPNAFSHYNYKYLGSSVENDKFIHRIQFSPKRSNAKLMTGILHIVGSLYCLHSFEASGAYFPGKFNLKVQYAEIQQNIWMPVNQNVDVDIEALGNKGEASYVSSVKYTKLVVDNKEVSTTPLTERVDKNVPPPVSKPKSKKHVKKQETLEKLMEKEELTTREMNKLASLLTEQGKDTSLSLELDRRMRIEVDSLAFKRDTVKWDEIRPVPLQEYEIKSLQQRDSLIAIARADTLGVKKKNQLKRKTLAKSMLLGGYYLTTDKKWWFYTEGINPLDQSFNTVDGFVPGYNFSTGYTIANINTSVRTNVKLSYSIARHEMMGNGSFGFPYWPSRRGYFGLQANYGSRDFSSNDGIHPFSNSVLSLFFRDNPLKLYHEKQVLLFNNIDLANGLVLSTSASVFTRDSLVNNSDFSFFYNSSRSYEPNVPDNQFYNETIKEVRVGGKLTARILFTPRYYYRMYDKRKVMVRSDYPTFGLSISMSHYGQNNGLAPLSLEFDVRQNVDLGVFRKVAYNLKAGTFVGSGNLHFADFKHFSAQNIWVVLNEKETSFMLLPFYQYSTNGWWAQAHLRYSAPFIALKYLPFFSNMIWNEGLFFSALATNNLPWYTEIGYGGTEILGSINITGFVGFHPTQKPMYGFRLGYNINRRGFSYP